jgi:prepilin-type N-terminal cleavage/methylation domain-containing protein
MKSNKQPGFTLVEIAIVLVVLGLLLGGILKGQQLINSARVRNLADQSSGIQAAYYGFIDRFRNLPGDMLALTACTTIGAAVDAFAQCGSPAAAPGGIVGANGGNGKIDTIAEAGSVWAHLSAAEFLNGTFSGQFGGAITPLTALTYPNATTFGAVPANAFQGPIMLAHSNSYQDVSARGTVNRLVYSFGGNVPVPILRDLDQKLDNGISGSGLIRSAAEIGDATVADLFAPLVDYTTGAALDCQTTGVAPAPDTWNVDSTNQTCNAVFLY